jgi:fatty-acyl-CoA synthase
LQPEITGPNREEKMPEVVQSTIGSRLGEVARRFPENEALVHVQRQVRYSFWAFLNEVDRLAKGLMALGIQRGDPVALWGPNCPEWLIVQFALAKIGATLVALDPGYSREDLEYALSFARVKTVLTASGRDGGYLEILQALIPEFWERGSKNNRKFPELSSIVTLFSPAPEPLLSLEDLGVRGQSVSAGELRVREESLQPEDTLMLLYTSGTTGKPKGVMVDHRGVLNKSLASTERLGITSNDRLCLFFPLFHMFGNTCIALAGLIRGAALVIPSDEFAPAEILSALSEERCTAIYGSPSMMVAIMEAPCFRGKKIETLRTGIIGGAPCPLEVMKRIVNELGVKEAAIAYGITEASSWLTQTLPDDPLELRVSTIGTALPNCEVKVIDPLTGEEVQDGIQGEICTRGLLMKGYFQNPEATALAIDREGWFHTGDLGVRDSRGYFRITGRLKEVIVKGGQEILPAEIEEVLFRMPGVALAAAFGVPDPERGEVIAAWIKPKEGAALSEGQVDDYCRSHLPANLWPDITRLVEDFPMTRSGKMQKFKMREIMIALSQGQSV